MILLIILCAGVSLYFHEVKRHFEDSPDDALGLFDPYGGEDPEESYRKLLSRLDILSAVFAVAAFVFLGFFMASM